MRGQFRHLGQDCKLPGDFFIIIILFLSQVTLCSLLYSQGVVIYLTFIVTLNLDITTCLQLSSNNHLLLQNNGLYHKSP